jgi:hypothetical protein
MGMNHRHWTIIVVPVSVAPYRNATSLYEKRVVSARLSCAQRSPIRSSTVASQVAKMGVHLNK